MQSPETVETPEQVVWQRRDPVLCQVQHLEGR